MARKRVTAEQIIIKMREAEAGLAQGQTVEQQAVVLRIQRPAKLAPLLGVPGSGRSCLPGPNQCGDRASNLSGRTL